MQPLRLASIRPLVRYVDEGQAVIDVHLALQPPLPTSPAGPESVDVLVDIIGADGSIDEQRVRIPVQNHLGLVRLQVVHPERWWPAGMGDQALYHIKLSLLANQQVADSRQVTVGFTSVRPRENAQTIPSARRRIEWLVNGQVCPIDAVVPIDLTHERRLLPVSGHSLLIVRGHYGPDVLYDAADRAGLLLIQCVPIDPDAQPEIGVLAEIDRLASHPSLAGWFVGHLGKMAESVAQTIHRLDPTRNIFHQAPEP